MELIDVITSKENLNRAYKKVVENKGAGGIDGMKVDVFCKPFLDKVAKHFWTLLHVQIGQSCNAWSTLLSRLTVALQTLFNYYSTRYGNGSSVSVSSCACSLK